jgi:Na+-transporting NADH:ubiquinone oxidoreductase subunit NqrC
MKVLSVKNPWAYLIMYKGKDIENRSWKTNYRGPILIHASKTSDLYAYHCLHAGIDNFNSIFIDEDEVAKIHSIDGCILGSIELCDCVQESDSRWAEKEGFWYWVLKNPKPCEPIPIKGSLGLWEYKKEICLLK